MRIIVLVSSQALGISPSFGLKTRKNKVFESNKRVYISTYGCQMNVNDTERMYSLLEMANYIPVSSPEEADIIIINACSVREKPVHKVYSEVGTFRQLKKKKPLLKIGVGGCVGQQEKENLTKASDLIDFVFGTDNIDILPSLVARVFEEGAGKIVNTQMQHRAPYHVETLVRQPGVSTFVNIVKGCDNFCTFCVVPFTRGREKSRPLKHILEDVQRLIRKGTKEVTLLGQNVNSYKSECGADLADLLERLADTDLLRIRFTTSHPKDFDRKLADVMGRTQPKVCEYIHLPFQAGSSRVLSRMNRGYTREDYLEKISMIRDSIPNVVLSTDIIVGFPGETEEDFLETISLTQKVGFETVFAFKYSPRPLTKAAQFSDQVEESVKDDRLNRLLKAHDEMARELVRKYDGITTEVLVEDFDEERGNFHGRSSQNKNVYFPGDKNRLKELIGQMVKVKITKAFPATLRGALDDGF